MANEQQKKSTGHGFFGNLFQDIFFGGKGYNTVKGNATPFPTKVILGAIVATVVFLFLVFSWIRLNETEYAIANMRKELSQVESKEEKLLNELNRLYPFPIIEAGAAELGLSPENGREISIPEFSDEIRPPET